MGFLKSFTYSALNQKLAKCLVLSLFLSIQTDSVTAADTAPEMGNQIYHANSGPWGNLSYYYVYLEAPDVYLKEFPIPNSIPQWTFQGYDVQKVSDLFVQAGLSQTFREYLLTPGNFVEVENQITIFPPLPDLEALTQEQRSVIYQELAKFPENEFYVNPVFFPDGDIEEWLKNSSLPERVHEKILKMSYKRGNVLAFSDVPALLNYLDGDEEVKGMLRAMTRTRSMIVRLDVSKSANVEELANYWTGKKRFKAILPFLDSVVDTEGVNTFDVVHLLPSLARRYIYTYVPLEYSAYGRMPDCHWTALNFFNHIPKQYFLDSRLSAEAVRANYEKVESDQLEFGDVLMFMSDPRIGEVIHSCVYIADDIVYTKNGESILAPWIMSKLSEVKNIYFPYDNGVVIAYRRKSDN